MTSTRTDVHSPTNLVTEDYDFAYCYDGQQRDLISQDRLNHLLTEGWSFGGVHEGDTCDHCGARLRYVAVLKHLPTRTLIKVGETCLDNRFSLATPAFHALRKAAAAARLTNKKSDRIHALVLAHPALQHLLDHDVVVERSEFLSDVAYKFSRDGELSVRQIAAVERAVEGGLRYQETVAARRAADIAALVDGTKIACPSGRTEVSGIVRSARVQISQYGTTVKCLVQDARGFKVWTTLPAAIVDALDTLGNLTYEEIASAAKDREVRFTATLEPSTDDALFGFAKRPTKAALRLLTVTA